MDEREEETSTESQQRAKESQKRGFLPIIEMAKAPFMNGPHCACMCFLLGLAKNYGAFFNGALTIVLISS